MINCSGTVVRDNQVFSEYPGAQFIKTPAVKMWPRPIWSEETLVSFDVTNVFLTNYFVPIDLDKGRLFINQTYSSVGPIFPPSVVVDGDHFELTAFAETLKGRHVLIGGPVDGNWWHWLYNWCPRIVLLRKLRPEIFAAPDVKFIVHPLAMTGSFKSILDTFGIPEDRLLPLDPSKGYVLEDVTLVSFLDQEKHFAVIMHAFAQHVLKAMKIERMAVPGRRLFASRQEHPRARRRIRNFDDVAPVLKELNFEARALGELSARDQIQLFYDADVVAGVHGSDFATLIFCRPETKVIVFEPERNLRAGLQYGLEWLCRVFYLNYTRCAVSEVNEEGGSEPTQEMLILNRDVILDKAAINHLKEFVIN